MKKKIVEAVVDAGGQKKDAHRVESNAPFYPPIQIDWAPPPLPPYPCQFKKRVLCTRQEQGTEEARLIDPVGWLVDVEHRIACDVYGGVMVTIAEVQVSCTTFSHYVGVEKEKGP